MIRKSLERCFWKLQFDNSKEDKEDNGNALRHIALSYAIFSFKNKTGNNCQSGLGSNPNTYMLSYVADQFSTLGFLLQNTFYFWLGSSSSFSLCKVL
jgi:hypothetical protein